MGYILINNELYAIEVVANPPLVGDEEDLTSIKIDDVSYKVGE